jgi:23S rRNA pseudouridine1911/1915/1917 synthase
LPPRRHFLHAAWLRFRHPESGAALDLRAPLPDDLRKSIMAAANDPTLETNPDPLEHFGFYRDTD